MKFLLVYNLLNQIRGYKNINTKYRFLLSTQSKALNEIKKFQWEKLISILRYASKNVPFYIRLFRRKNLTINKISRYEDFAKYIPIVDKKIISEELEDFISKERKKENLILNYSSGTTGTPFCFYQDKHFISWAKAHQLRNYHWCKNYSLGDKIALLWGSEIYFKKKDLLDKISNKFINRIEFNTFFLNENKAKYIIKKLNDFQPHLISTYPSSLMYLIRVIKKYNLKPFKVKAIQTTSEPLLPVMRNAISECFNTTNVFDKYGSRETNVIAHECPLHKGMHINAENNFVEFIKNGSSIEKEGLGEIVVTNLNNKAMPLIRYRTGDIAARIDPSCNCGINLPKMSFLKGRKSDIIWTRDNGMIDSYLFSYVLMKYDIFEQFQVIQDDYDSIVIKLAPKTKLNIKSYEKEIRTRIIKLSEGMINKIDFRYCDTIQVSNSGKYRPVISNIGASFL